MTGAQEQAQTTVPDTDSVRSLLQSTEISHKSQPYTVVKDAKLVIEAVSYVICAERRQLHLIWNTSPLLTAGLRISKSVAPPLKLQSFIVMRAPDCSTYCPVPSI